MLDLMERPIGIQPTPELVSFRLRLVEPQLAGSIY